MYSNTRDIFQEVIPIVFIRVLRKIFNNNVICEIMQNIPKLLHSFNNTL